MFVRQPLDLKERKEKKEEDLRKEQRAQCFKKEEYGFHLLLAFSLINVSIKVINFLPSFILLTL